MATLLDILADISMTDEHLFEGSNNTGGGGGGQVSLHTYALIAQSLSARLR